MAVPPRLPGKLRGALGPDAAEDLVTWISELESQGREMRADFAEFRQEMLAAIQSSETRLLEHIHKVESDVGQRIQGVEIRLGESIAEVKTLGQRIQGMEVRLGERIGDVKGDLMKWSLVFWVSAVAAIAALAGVLRQP